MSTGKKRSGIETSGSGKVNTIVMRTIDVIVALPSVLLAIVNSIVSLTIVFTPQIARFSR